MANQTTHIQRTQFLPMSTREKETCLNVIISEIVGEFNWKYINTDESMVKCSKISIIYRSPSKFNNT